MRMAAPPLPEELEEEVLLRFPPDDPASLARAALVSKRWCRLISGARHGFGRRFRELHRSPPLLGFLCNRLNRAGAGFDAAGVRFVPMSSFRPPNADRRRGWRAVHSGHDRVLLHHASTRDDDRLVIWDPVTDEQRELPKTPLHGEPELRSWNAAVLCAAAAAAAAGGGCNHLHCPFLVVLVGTSMNRQTFSCVYQSEADGWSEPVFDRLPYHCLDPVITGALVRNSIYFMYERGDGILKYDLQTQEMSAIDGARTATLSSTGTRRRRYTVLMATEDGRLGLATVRDSRLYLWSREDGPNQEEKWAVSRVIELYMLLPGVDGLSALRAMVAGFADNGAGGVIFISTAAGFFTIDLKSSRAKKVGDSRGFNDLVVPYMSFCTPALGTVSVDEEPGAGASSA